MKKILKTTFFLLVFVTAIRSQDQNHDLKNNSDSKKNSSIQDTSTKKIVLEILMMKLCLN